MPPKQGDALDPSLGIAKAWWVTHPRVFLFRPPPNQPFITFKLPSGEECFGFNVEALAKTRTSQGRRAQETGDIVLNNKIGGLSVREEPGTVTTGVTIAIDFIFTLPTGDIVRAPIKIMPIDGSA